MVLTASLLPVFPRSLLRAAVTTWTLIHLAAAPALSTAPRKAQPFVGTWVAEFEGEAFLEVEIRDTSPLTGRVSTGEFSIDADGNLTGGKRSRDRYVEVVEARVEAGRLRFRSKGSDQDVTEYEMFDAAGGKARLAFPGTPIKPIALWRADHR